ncbi:MAG: hypothetical protein AAF840_14305 [Bacteroidota bacterium]
MKYYRIFAVLILLSSGNFLDAQSFRDSEGIQWASTIRFGLPLLPIGDFEPPENGGRINTGFRLDTEFEARVSERISLLALFTDDNIYSYLDPNASSDAGVDLSDPFGLVHPYTSTVELAGLQLGIQYNLRVGNGDFSLGILSGLGAEFYSRTYDIITGVAARQRLSGISYNESELVQQWVNTFRLQYTHWLGRRFALNLGVHLHTSQYMSGGIETSRGLRYVVEYQEISDMPVPYNLNYDRTTVMPNPTKYVKNFTRLYLHLGVTSRF